MLRTPAILVSCQKLTTQLSSCCNAFWCNIYPFNMPGPPGEFMTTEKFIYRELNQKSSTYGHVTKLFIESEFQHKGNKQTKKHEFSAKSCSFLGSNRFRDRALDLRNLGPKFGPIPKAKRYVFFPILDEKFPIWQSVFGSGKYQV